MTLPISPELYNAIQKLEPAVRDALLKMLQEVENLITKNLASEVTKQVLSHVPKKEEHDELKEALKLLTIKVAELAEAQKQTEQRINELAEAQKQTEKELKELTTRVNELTDRLNQLTARVDELTARVNELTDRLNQLTARVDELTARVNELTARVNDLTIKVAGIELKLNKLIEEHRETRKQLGELTHAVGYTLEDRAMRTLPQLLLQDWGLKIEGELDRDFIEVSPKKHIEINILGKGKINDKEVIIVGECKSQLSIKHIDSLISKGRKVQELMGKDVFLVAIAYLIHPQVRKYAEEKGVKLYKSTKLR